MKIIHINENDEVADLVKSVKEDLFRRQIERKKLENQWKINLSFINGNQYVTENSNSNVVDENKKFYWQEKKAYNHIAGLLEIRQSKLCSNKPSITVVPASSDSQDLATARTCQAICQSLWNKNKLSNIISKAINWSESCGTAFYKVTWNGELGDLLIDEDGKEIYSGDVKIDVISPFEIYPQSLNFESLEENESIIHARAFTLSKIKEIYGIDVKAEKLDTFDSNFGQTLSNLNNSKLGFSQIDEEKYAFVIEKYILPTKEFPNGRLVIVCGDYLCYDGELPYVNVTHKKRGYPFIKQVAYPKAGSFFGTSIVERVIPLQQDYNIIKNRKIEFLNRISMGIVLAEDGAIDVDNLEEEGLEPGKVIVYRQGANPPTFMPSSSVPVDYMAEEARILNEFNSITGVSDLLRQSNININNISGTALQILLEQENARLSVTVESLNSAICEIASQVLRLYKQFATFPRILKIVGEKGGIDAICFNAKDITSDEIVLDTQSEAITTMAQKRSLIYEVLSSGILEDENGKISNTTRQKLIEMLGLGVYDMGNDETSLQVKFAQKENLEFSDGNKNISVQEIDAHEIHIKEHTCLLLSAESDKLKKNKMYDVVLEHIREHKKFQNLTNNII